MKKAGKLFIKGLIKSCIGVALLLGVAAISYRLVFRLFHISEETKEAVAEYAGEQEVLLKASVDDISKHLIFCVDEEGEVIRLLLEVYHCAQRRMCYFTIPTDTRITMSDSLYQKVMLVNPSVPQMMKLSGITKSLPEESAYEYGVLLIEELLNIKMSYYTIVPVGVYGTVFETEGAEEEAGAPAKDGGKVERAYPREVFSKEFLTRVHNFQIEEDVNHYLEEMYEEIDSNLSLVDKRNYIDSYLKLTSGDISFEVIAGEKTNSAYLIDNSLAAEQLARITGQAD